MLTKQVQVRAFSMIHDCENFADGSFEALEIMLVLL